MKIKKYLVCYCIEHPSGMSFHNVIVECDGNPVSILKCIRGPENGLPYIVNLINFWEIEKS